MDRESLKKMIHEDVIPELDDFLERDSALFLYLWYEDTSVGVNVTIAPIPPSDDIDDVIKVAAKEIYGKMNNLPTTAIVCEKIRYSELQDNIYEDGANRGLVFVGIDAQTAQGHAMLYSLPDMEFLSSEEIDKDNNENAPPIAMIAISTFMYETLVQSDLIEGEKDVSSESPIEFKFSDN